MNNLQYTYVSVINATPEQIWEALTSPEFTARYWHQTRVRSDFQLGSKIEFLVEGDLVGCDGEILTCDPPRELSYTWRF